MVVPRALLVGLTVLLVAPLLAGCISEKDAPTPPAPVETDECLVDGLCGADAVLDETGRDLRTDLTAADSLPAPTWVVGDVFEQHLYYGSADATGEHIQTMVVDDAGACYQFGTTSKTAASTEAVFDLPILGCIAKANLATSAFDTDWGWMYDFPLTDGKTWQGSVNGLFNWNDNAFYSYEFTLTASYAEKIDTPMGDFPGFEITGVTPDGDEILSYNYVPAVGWFSHFWMYDLASEAADDVMFHAMSMGRSTGFTGTYYIDESETVLESFFMPGISTLAGEEAQPTFVVPEGATYIQGVVVPIACAGVSRVTILSPSNGQQEFEHQGTDPSVCAAMMEGQGDGPSPVMYTVYFYDGAAEAGEWRILPVGAGVYGYFVWLEAVTEVAYELAAADTGDASEAL